MQLDLSRFSPAERSTLQLRVLYEGAGYRKFRCSHFEEYSLYQQNERFLSDSLSHAHMAHQKCATNEHIICGAMQFPLSHMPQCIGAVKTVPYRITCNPHLSSHYLLALIFRQAIHQPAVHIIKHFFAVGFVV